MHMPERVRNYKSLIKQLPINKHSFIVKFDNWTKFERISAVFRDLLVELFHGQESIVISRKDLFRLGSSDRIDKFIISVILWGYPRGMRGRNFSMILQNFNLIVDHINILKTYRRISWSNELIFLQNFNGIGISTYSKLLYFLRLKLNNNPCLILDERIMNVFENFIFTDFRSLNRKLGAKTYPDYLKIIKQLSNRIQVSPDKIEMFLFIFGNNLKTL